MSSTLSAEAVPSTTYRATGGRFAKNNPGGPGNPFARQTAALRAALISGVTERDIQDILDILLLNAKGGHLPTTGRGLSIGIALYAVVILIFVRSCSVETALFRGASG